MKGMEDEDRSRFKLAKGRQLFCKIRLGVVGSVRLASGSCSGCSYDSLASISD